MTYLDSGTEGTRAEKRGPCFSIGKGIHCFYRAISREIAEFLLAGLASSCDIAGCLRWLFVHFIEALLFQTLAEMDGDHG